MQKIRAGLYDNVTFYPNEEIEMEMKYFEYGHLPEGPLRDTSKACSKLATKMEDNLDGSAEKSAGMRKLLEAKDCFVRAAIQTP